MDHTHISRRALVGAASTLPIAALLAGCAGGTGGLDLAGAIARLLTLSSERAFATLLQPNGFYDSQVARIAMPPQFARGSGLLQTVLSSAAVRDRLQRSLNGIARSGAERAAPLIADSIRTLTVADALSIVRGAPDAATRLLEGQMGTGLIGAMFPAIGDALRVAGDPMVGQALRAATGYDLSSLARDVTDGANRGIWNAIASEEQAIRANPRSTNDALLIAVFTLAGAA